MPTLDCETDRRDGLTLVECVVHNDTADRRRVRLTNRLDGPVRSPSDGPGPDWTDGTARCTLAPGERAAVGYATPAPPRAPPVELRHAIAERGDAATADAPVPAPSPPGERPGDEPDGEPPVRGDGTGVALPPAVEAWLSALEERVAAVEDERRERTGHPTALVDGETLAALERRAAVLGERLATAREGVERA